MTTCLVHLVTDRAARDPARAELAARVGLGLPGATVDITSVPPCDTLAAGFCVGQLVLCEPPPPRIVVHDVAARPGDPGPWPSGTQSRLCVGRSATGTLVVGANIGWTWSFAVVGLRGLCALDVPARGEPRPDDCLPAAIVHAGAAHPHAVREALSRSHVPRLPADVVAFVDDRGDVKTTISALPAAAGARVLVRIGDIAADAVISDGNVAPGDGELALARAPSGHLELLVRDGRAADRFDTPASGAPVEITSPA